MAESNSPADAKGFFFAKMKFTILINQVKANEWNLNLSQAVLFAFCYELPSWADKVFINNEIYYFASKNKIVNEMPLLGDKVDTIYRLLKQLEEKGLIIVKKQGKKDFVKLTSISKEWNSEKNPTSEIYPLSPGNKSENNPEINPTNKNTNTDKKIKDKKPTTPEVIKNKKIDFCLKLIAWDTDNPKKYPKLLYVAFARHWMELNKNGKSIRVDSETFFDMGKRLATWFGKAKDFEITKHWEAESSIKPLNELLKKLF